MTLALRAIFFSTPELCTNGQFNSSNNWTTESSWAVANGVATKTAGVAGSLYQAAPKLIEGYLYRMKLTVTRTAGSVYPFLRGTNSLLVISADGTYSVDVRAGADAVYAINIYADAAFAGAVDAISVKRISA